MERRRDPQRGAAAVEFLLSIPALVLIVFGGLHLGMAVSARNRLADSVAYAARTESIAAATTANGAIDGGRIQTLVSDRMKSASECTNTTVGFTDQGVYPYRYLSVNATCTLNSAPFLSAVTGSFGLTEVSASAAFPIAFDPN
jgi:Flp pilus assembly protein TadG